jgi:hypothetical protein
MALISTTIDSQNSLITPQDSPVSANRRTNIQTWLVVLSGVAVAQLPELQGPGDTRIVITPDVTGPINTAVNAYGFPKPPVDDFLGLNVEQWAFYAAVGSTFSWDIKQPVDAGFNVNWWQPSAFTTVTDATTGVVMNQIFTGIQVDIEVRKAGPVTYLLPYNITLVAQIASAPRKHVGG